MSWNEELFKLHIYYSKSLSFNRWIIEILNFFTAKVTPRKEANHIIPSQVPGLDLDLSPRGIVPPTAQYTQKDSYHEPQYTENRVLTPNKYRQQGHTSEFGTQTGMKVGDQLDTDRDGVYR